MTKYILFLFVASLLSGLSLSAERKEKKNIAECNASDKDINKYYSGECKDGLAHGKGVASGRDKYSGPFMNGEPHGKGRYEWGPSSEWAGDIYEGDFVNGNRTGNGVYVYGNGDRYEGDFLKGSYDGFGVLTVPIKNAIGKRFRIKGKHIDGKYIFQGIFRNSVFVLECSEHNECASKWMKTQENSSKDNGSHIREVYGDKPNAPAIESRPAPLQVTLQHDRILAREISSIQNDSLNSSFRRIAKNLAGNPIAIEVMQSADMATRDKFNIDAAIGKAFERAIEIAGRDVVLLSILADENLSITDKLDAFYNAKK